jgi:CHAT domain-containing protein
MTNKKQPIRIAIALLCLTAAAVPAAENTREPGADCGIAGARLIETAEVEVAGQTRVSRAIDIPGDRLLLISSIEQGIDVRMLVTGDRDALSADSPTRRWGPQRILLEPRKAGEVVVALLGKERVTGRARIEVRTFPAAAAHHSCIEALRSLARGDALYDRGQAVTLGTVDAGTRSAREEYAAAERSYRAATTRLASPRNLLLLAQAQLSRATIFDLVLDRYEEALAPANAARDAFTAADEVYGRDRARAVAASANLDLALAERKSKDVDLEAETRARNRLESTRAEWLDIANAHSARGESYDEALALNFAGLTYTADWDFAPAIGYFERALAIQKKLGERTRMGQVMQNLALAQNDLGRFALARQTYNQAFEWLDAGENPKLYADTMNNLALTEYRLGHIDAALRHFSEALEILTRIQNPREQARSLSGIGVTYYAVGKRAEAVSYYHRALEILERDVNLDPVGRLAVLVAIADSERDAGRPLNAIAHRRQALLLTHNAKFQLRIRIALAQDLVEARQLSQAEMMLRDLFANDLSRDPVATARALLVRAQLRLAESSFDRAEQDAQASFSAFQKLELSASAFKALTLQARAACAGKDAATAQRLVREALARADTLRSASDNPSFRASTWGTLRPAYDLGVRLAASPAACGGKAPPDALRALGISERARNRALEDFQRIADAARAGAISINDRKRLALLDQIAEKRAGLEQLAALHEGAEKPMQVLRDEVSGLLRELDIAGAQAGPATAAAEGSNQPVRRAAETLRPDTAVVEYWLGETKSYAWLITRGRVQMVELGDTAPIESVAREFHGALRQFARIRASERVRLARQLHALLIAPLPKDFLSARRLYFVPDGMLHGVPFAALVTNDSGPPQYLVSSHDVAVSTSLRAVPDGQPVQVADGASVLIVADPVYSRSDERFAHVPRSARAFTPQPAAAARPADAWSRLAGAGREAESITATLSSAKIETITGFAANRESVLQRDLRQYRVLHFATHALADLESPQLSMLVLSQFDEQGTARVGELFAGDLLYRPLEADLVVFSGCETALGESNAGEGLFSLRYVAHAAGGRTVVASLWPVTDLAGETLIREFYTALSRERLAPEAALSRAMRVASRRWPDPALWSVFEVSRVTGTRTLH